MFTQAIGCTELTPVGVTPCSSRSTASSASSGQKEDRGEILQAGACGQHRQIIHR